MRQENRPSRRFCRLAAAVGAALAFQGAPAAIADARPSVEVELRIKSDLLKSTGLDLRKGAIETGISAWLAESLEKTLSYVHWVGRTPDGARPPYGLVARLVDRPGTGCGTRLELAFAVRVKTGEADFPPEWITALGDECDLDLPTRDAERLAALLREKLAKRLAQLPFRQAVEVLLTRGVPLAKTVKMENQSIGVPLSPTELRADFNTRFRVEFDATEDGTTRSGNMEMLLSQAATWGGVCRVAAFQFGAFSIPSVEIPGAVGWHPQFARIFDPSRLRALTIKMSDYRQTLNPSGPLADAPQSEP